LQKINALRERHSRLRSSLSYYEELAATQAEQLSVLNKPRDFPVEEEEQEPEEVWTAEDLRKEEDEVRELERKKKALEDRVAGYEADLQF